MGDAGGHAGFQADGEAAALHAIVTYVQSPATALRRDADPAWDAFFGKALARDPAARFASARAMADALGEIAGTRGEGAAERVAELVEAFRARPAIVSPPAGDDAPTLVATPSLLRP